MHVFISIKSIFNNMYIYISHKFLKPLPEDKMWNLSMKNKLQVMLNVEAAKRFQAEKNSFGHRFITLTWEINQIKTKLHLNVIFSMLCYIYMYVVNIFFLQRFAICPKKGSKKIWTLTWNCRRRWQKNSKVLKK